MTMPLDDAIEFIMAKFELIAANCILAREAEDVRQMATGLQSLWDHPRLSLNRSIFHHVCSRVPVG